MNIIFFGTPEFALMPLKQLINDGHKIVAVVTQPDRLVGRKKIMTPPPVKVYAQSLGLKVLQFERVKNHAQELRELSADIMITCAYGQILTKEIIEICRYGIVNIHASLLPKYRGASPISAAILNGEKVAGITIMQTDIGLDTGDILLQKKLEINNGENCGALTKRLSELGAKTVSEFLIKLEKGEIIAKKQEENEATTVKTIKKSDALIDFNKTAQEIINTVLAYNPWPVAYTYLNGQMLKVYDAQFAPLKSLGSGKVVCADIKNGLIIGGKDYCIKVEKLQLAGGKILSANQFVIGNKVKVGDQLNG